MRKLVLVLCLCFGFSNLLFSQTPINPLWQWGNSFDGNVSSMIKDGDYLYVTGYYQNSSMSMTGLPLLGGTDVYVMKIDTLGNVIWAKSIAGSGNDVSVRIVRNAAGHLFVAGNFTSPTLTTGSSSISNLGNSDIYMAEFDANGNGIALTNYGSAGNDSLNDFCLDATGQYYFQKSTELVVYSAASTLLWQKTFSSGSNIHYSTADNAVYVSGLFQGTMTLGSMSISSETGIYGVQPDVFVVKFDINGNLSWLKNITNSSRAEYNALSYFDQASNALYLTFNYTYLASGAVCFIYKVSNTGNAINFASRSSNMVNSISANGNFVSIVNSGYYDMNSMSFTPSGLYVFDITNSANNIIYSPYESQNKAHLFDGINSIYAGRAVNPSTGNYTIGRFGHSELAAVNQQQSAVACGNSPTAALTGSFSGGNGTIQYAWTPSTGLSSTNSLTTTASLAVGTTMNYTLTATDSMGLVAYNYFSVTAPVPTTPPVIIPSSPTLCSGSMTLSTASTGTITWFNVAYPMQTIGNGQTITIAAPGDYICSVDSNGCSQNDTISIVKAVNVSIAPSSTFVCLGQPLILTASGGLNYSWTQNVINGVSFTPNTTETYTVTASDINGCTDSKSITIPVNELPVINSVVATPSALCNQGNSTLTLNVPSSAYCVPTCYPWPGANGDAITLFKFGTSINNSSADAPSDYSYYSSLVANVVAGQIYPIEIHSDAGDIAIWIDFNGDGDFIDPNELVVYYGNVQAVYTDMVQIPTTAINGSYRMRVASGISLNALNGTKSCNQSSGEYEDYLVSISGGMNKVTWSPTTFLSNTNGVSVVANNINTNITYTATLHSPNGCSSSQSVNINTDTVTTTTNLTLCSTQIPYSWNGQTITTSGTYSSYFTGVQGCDSVAYLNVVVTCCVPTGLSLSVIGYNSATAIWTAGSGNTSFDVRYKAVSDTTWNIISGITGSSVQLTGLAQCNFAHEFQVRRNCSNGMTSAWSSSKLFNLANPPCGQPSLLSPQSLSASSVQINWTPSSNPSSTTIEYRAVGSTIWQVLNVSTGNTVTITNLNAATNYEYRLKSNCSSSSSCYTSINTVATQVCYAPYNLSLSFIGQTSATAIWTLSSFNISVDLRYKPVSGTTWTTVSGITSANYTMTNLVPGTQYEFQLSASCGNSNSNFSSSKLFFTQGGCPLPSGLTMSVIGATNATCLWTSLAGLNMYNLRYKAVASPTWIVVNGLTTNSYSLTGLSPTTLYEYQVERICGSGYTTSKQFTTQSSCPVPTGLVVTYNGTTIAELAWTSIPGLNNYTLRYRIYNTTTWTTITGLTTNSYILTGLSPNTNYEYQVERSCVSGYSTSKLFYTAVCPNTNLWMWETNLQSNSATCHWQQSGYGTPTNLPTYKFRYKRTADTAWTTVTNIITTSYSLSNLLPGTEYEYQVNHENCGWTPSKLFTAICPEVTQILITQLTSNSALVSWNGIGPNYTLTLNGTGQQTITINNVTASNYLFTGLSQGINYFVGIKLNCTSSSSNYIYQSFTTPLSCSLPVPSGLTMSAIGNTSGTCLWTSVAGASSYNLQYRVLGTTTWNFINNVPSNTYALSGLAQQTTYEYQVSANCTSGVTNFSASKQFTTTTSCMIPSGLTLTAWTTATGSTKWNAVSGATNYDLKYKSTNATSWNQVAGIVGTTYLLTNLAPGTNYEFQVKTNCSNGGSVYSSSKYFATTSACPIPTGLTLTSWADNYGATKWTAVAGATSYDLQYKAASSSTWIQVPALATNAYWIASLSPATQYEFQVRTNCGANASSYSASKFFTTSALCASTYDNSSNNASTGAVAIPLLTPIKGSIASATDVDYYKFGITNSSNVYISLSTLPADYDLTVFNTSMVQVASSNSTGTTSEYILLTSPAVGIYYVKVNGIAGANSSTQCYTLKVNNNGSYLKPIAEDDIQPQAEIDPLVYPNPTNGELNIQFTTKETSTYSVRVMDLAGKQIYASGEQTASVGEQTHTLRLSDYSIAEGVYIVATTVNEQRYFQRVVYRK